MSDKDGFWFLPTFEEIKSAHVSIAGSVMKTPLVKLQMDTGTDKEIYLKLENLQGVGSFKIRGATNALVNADPEMLKNGVYTASAGNMALGLAWHAKKLRINCTCIVPNTAPEAKLAALERLGANCIKVSFEDWWNVIITHQYPGQEGLFVHPVIDRNVIAGNGTIGLEILEDLPDVDAILVPYGGGGLNCGIAVTCKTLNPSVSVYACEVETAAPCFAAFSVDKIVKIDTSQSFIDGIGSSSVIPEIWPAVRSLIAGSITSSESEIASAVRVLIERNHIVAEGAGAASVAAAIKSPNQLINCKKIVCIVTGGNIDSEKLVKILHKII